MILVAAAEAKAQVEADKAAAIQAKEDAKRKAVEEKERLRAEAAARREAEKPGLAEKMVQSAARSAATSIGRQIAGRAGGQLLRGLRAAARQKNHRTKAIFHAPQTQPPPLTLPTRGRENHPLPASHSRCYRAQNHNGSHPPPLHDPAASPPTLPPERMHRMTPRRLTTPALLLAATAMLLTVPASTQSPQSGPVARYDMRAGTVSGFMAMAGGGMGGALRGFGVLGGSTGIEHQIVGQRPFHHPGGRAKLIPLPFVDNNERPDSQYPFWLNSGRLVEHFHTRTRTGKVGNNNKYSPIPFVEINPDAAAELQ